MFRDITNPWVAGGFGERCGVKTFGDRTINNGLTFLGKQFDELLLLTNKFIDLGSFLVQKVNDCLLGRLRRKNDWEPLYVRELHGLSQTAAHGVKHFLEVVGP